jgi:hypothetical protein
LLTVDWVAKILLPASVKPPWRTTSIKARKRRSSIMRLPCRLPDPPVKAQPAREPPHTSELRGPPIQIRAGSMT